MSIDSTGLASASQFATSLISKLDTGQKGYVDQSDLETAFSSISGSDPSASTSSADQLFAKLDTNGDGKVTASELSSSLKTFADSLMQQLHQASGRQGGGIHAQPTSNSQSDSSDPGLTQAEISAVAADPATDSKRAAALSTVASNFAAADTNGDGRVTRSEARSFMHKSHAASALTSTTTDSTTSTDTDTTALAAATTASPTSDASSSSSSSTDNLMVMLRIMQLAQAYGISAPNGAASSAPVSVQA